MRYLSLFSGVEAATLAWEPLGWEAVAFAEVAPFPSAVLAERWPHVPNLGDITAIDWSAYRGSVDLVVGGSPCQSFSVAGLRRGLDDPRGNLALAYLKVVDRVRPRWVVWENVPGVLSSGRGRDFGAFLGALAKLGYGFAYRVLDAQHFGVPQRRRRVFVVGHSGAAWQRCAAVLFDGPSLRGDPQPRQQARAQVARSLTASTGGCSAKEQQYTFVDGASEPLNALEGDAAPLIMASGQANAEIGRGVCPTLAARQYKDQPILEPVAFRKQQRAHSADDCETWGEAETSNTLNAFDDHCDARATHAVCEPHAADAVRRLTPRECERLQGMPDDHTRLTTWSGWRDVDDGETREELEAEGLMVKATKSGALRVNDPDGPRYKAIGNSMAVPVMHWIGERIEAVLEERRAARERAARKAREEALRVARAARASAATSTRRAKYASGTEQWRALCERYFPGHADEALYVIRGESGGNPQASNGICRGLFQIHECHAATFQKVTGRPYWDGVYDPDANAHFAAHLSGAGTNWSAWSVRP